MRALSTSMGNLERFAPTLDLADISPIEGLVQFLLALFHHLLTLSHT